MKNIAVFANQKGGVGKTTCTVNIGFELARLGHSILMIDLDPQGNLTSWCGLDPDDCTMTVYDIIKNNVEVSETVVAIGDNLRIVPANILLASVERELFASIGYERILKKALDSVRNEYDHILIDCPPSLGTLTINGLVAGDEVYITVACEHLSVIGTTKLLETIDAVKENYNPTLEIGRVIPTMYSNTVLAGEMLKQLDSFFGEKLARIPIRRNVKIGESSAMGQSIFQYDPKSIGAKDFENLVKELV